MQAASGRIDAQPATGGASPWTAIDWRAHRRWVQLPTGPVNVVEMGSGPIVLLVHGLGGSWQNWLENIARLAAAGHRVVALDLPGFGASPVPESEEISIAGYARVLDALCTELGVDEPVAVVGNSMGGFISAELAVVVPRRVERLVLVAAAGLTSQQLRGSRQLAGLRRAQNLFTLATAWTATRSEALARRPRTRRALMRAVVAHPERMSAALAAEQIRGSGKPGFFAALEAIINYQLRDRLDQVVCPALVVWGALDRLVPVRDADEFVRLIDDARKVVYEDVGHVPMLEAPARFNADVLAFLAEDRPAAR